MIDIVFLGTPDFAVPSLKALVENGYRVKAVFTQPDRPKGRGNKLTYSPVKEYALQKGLTVYQPEKIRLPEPAAVLRALKPDLMVTAAFGQILSKENLDSARLGCVNVHGSLLPAYRGSSPIQWAVINGEKETGITTMYTAIGVDCGDMILQKKINIGENETAGELFERMAPLGAEVLLETVRLIEEGKAPRIPQDEKKATHFPMLDKKSAAIDFAQEALKIKNLIRGLNPWPVAWTMCGKDVIKVYSATVLEQKAEAAPGTVVCADEKQGLIVCTGDQLLSLDVIQLPGKKAMEARLYLRGNSLSDKFLYYEAR